MPGTFPKPLYVLDSLQVPLALGDSVLRILIPNDIINIIVLKGYEATARYGTAGKNGVIEMTTVVPYVVRGKLLVQPADKIAVLGAIRPTQVQAIHWLTLQQTKRYKRRAERAALEVLLTE